MSSREGRRTLICISQVYVPDPTSVGQHMADAAEAMAEQGYRVVVYTASRGYDDPTQRYPLREERNGVTIRRIPFASFGKRNLVTRVVAQLSFLAQSALRASFTRRPAGLLTTTSPPMASLAALLLRRIRGIPIVYWAMDINPDQAIALGEVSADSLPARLLGHANQAVLDKAGAVITLDRFMAERLMQKADLGDRLHILPPWPHEQHITPIEHPGNPFRNQYARDGELVVLYSGNHSLAHPLETLIDAAIQMRNRSDVKFLFVGGGLAKPTVDAAIEQHKLQTAASLPYQPLDQIRYSLSAGDVHIAVIGNEMVGCVHPSKVYAAMAAQRPVLLIGPAESHVGDLIEEYRIGWQVDHGDVDRLTELLTRLADHPEEPTEAGARAREVVVHHLSRANLTDSFTSIVAGALNPPTASR
ncbi:MAG: glycosyltransferase family 4 protein [Acidimicrobiia bacterium]|nr:glycosyltransferase family 4 protein [Acidimicrobiia bacterium]